MEMESGRRREDSLNAAPPPAEPRPETASAAGEGSFANASMAAARDDTGAAVEEDPDVLQRARMQVHTACDEENGLGSGGGGTTTVEFLMETTDAVLPDVFTGLFAKSSAFVTRGLDSVRRAVPDPLRAAAGRTGEGLSRAADFAADIACNPAVFVSRAIPDAVLSPELKRLLLVDLVNTLRCYFSLNVLVMPYLFSLAGLVGGLLLVLGLQALSVYTSRAFFTAKNQLRDARHVLMYGDVPRLTWGRWYPMMEMWLSAAFLIAYAAFAAANTRVLLVAADAKGFDWGDAARPASAAAVEAYESLLRGGGSGGTTFLCYFLPCLAALPFCLCKRAKHHSAVHAVSSLLLFACFLALLALFPAPGRRPGAYPPSVPLAQALWPRGATDAFVALGIAVYACTPLRLSVPVERTMPSRRFARLSACSCAAATAAHVLFGVLGLAALRRGGACSVLSQSLLRDTRVGRGDTVAVAALLFAAFALVLPQPLFRLGEVLDRRALGWREVPAYWRLGPNLLRLAALAAACLVAYVFPHYGLVLAAAGSFFCGIVGVAIPSALDAVRRRRVAICENRRLRWGEHAALAGLAVLTAAVVGAGTLFSMYGMWEVVLAGNKESC